MLIVLANFDAAYFEKAVRRQDLIAADVGCELCRAVLSGFHQ